MEIDVGPMVPFSCNATNAGVVGSDNFVYAWADRYPDFHDIPSRDFTLTEKIILQPKETDPAAKTTGAFTPLVNPVPVKR